MHLTRYQMYHRIGQCFREPIKGKILGISGIKYIQTLVDKTSSEIVLAQFPEYDVQNLPFDDETFDYVLCDQVIEHIENPAKAIKETLRVLKKGGIAIYTTCFLNYFHPAPIDFWRFSPQCLKWLCNENGFTEIIQCEGWGNRLAMMLCLLSEQFARSGDIPNSKWSIRHFIATHNDQRYPMTTWVVAKK